MNGLETENKVKLHMLTSLARSQRALARMLESVADAMESGRQERPTGGAQPAGERAQGSVGAPPEGREWLAQLVVLGRYQRAMAERLGLLRLRRIRRGVPGKPWLNPRLKR
ncbi:hypothetical protein SAMN02799630_02775 [Paenibacillus sp. UNCCL117]|uniref:hypothetical protein n=1 Tax=unclassified Paenibacillus TaxID=185978 RepID=UPI00087EB3D3|nr:MULTISPECIES: hypothetical protein [unclassified Paenibacillus]SDD29885.1 hypothetical protein SAMN04488602_107192 [Paenibacillus sp. cl123]SFW40444.1 hypothetical protein SAMN02799630_02775 [Paenibacillus sp. UNCCL117]